MVNSGPKRSAAPTASRLLEVQTNDRDKDCGVTNRDDRGKRPELTIQLALKAPEVVVQFRGYGHRDVVADYLK